MRHTEVATSRLPVLGCITSRQCSVASYNWSQDICKFQAWISYEASTACLLLISGIQPMSQIRSATADEQALMLGTCSITSQFILHFYHASHHMASPRDNSSAQLTKGWETMKKIVAKLIPKPSTDVANGTRALLSWNEFARQCKHQVQRPVFRLQQTFIPGHICTPEWKGQETPSTKTTLSPQPEKVFLSKGFSFRKRTLLKSKFFVRLFAQSVDLSILFFNTRLPKA